MKWFLFSEELFTELYPKAECTIENNSLVWFDYAKDFYKTFDKEGLTIVVPFECLIESGSKYNIKKQIYNIDIAFLNKMDMIKDYNTDENEKLKLIYETKLEWDYFYRYLQFKFTK